MEQLQESIFPDKPIPYASFWSRFVAAFVDEFFVFVAWFIVGLSFKDATVSIINLLVALLYNPLMEAGPRQATLGKSAMRIKVTDLEGGRITYGQAFGRHFGKILSAAIFLIGFLMMLWNKDKQTLHDRMAGTRVVKE